ncbi:hypothetical protein TUBRATIS_000060 [Tubulinosema ratisbonensis]|uniref:Uncharacterized protein n=1 Tax=Tubulinosema ratisbonensis TaxID=291195 RepID=A0A437AR07_9MICR|nr:hypothetical protein TUBRATIS_000060 [Tubulinosema ratisbonensis]
MHNFKKFVDEKAKTYSLKFPEGKSNLQIIKVNFKLNGDCIFVHCKVPNLEKEKTLIFFGYGHTPEKETYHGKVFHSEKMIIFKKIEKIYNLFQYFDEIKEEEIEFKEMRNKGINFYFQQFFIDKGKEYFYEYSNYFYNKIIPFKREKIEKIEKNSLNEIIQTIHRLKIFNLQELRKIYPEISISLVKEMCIFFKGRFILKNIFYDSEIQKERKTFLEFFLKNKFIKLKEAKEILKTEFFILEELCYKKENLFYLKGYEECLGLENEELEILNEKEKIMLLLLKKYKILSCEILKKETGISYKNISSFLDDKIILLSNDCLVLKNENKLRSEFIDLFKNKRSIRKNEIIKELTSKFNVLEIEEVSKEFCEQKGPNWILKNKFN